MVVVAPEMLISLAAGGWRGASLGLKAFRRNGHKNVKDWTWGHACFANMGGLKFEMQRGGTDLPFHESFEEMSQMIRETMRHTTLQDLGPPLGNYKTSRRRVAKSIWADCGYIPTYGSTVQGIFW
jgi:hypothetical protein